MTRPSDCVTPDGDAEPTKGQRLDQFLAAKLPDLSRSQIQRLIRDGPRDRSRGAAKTGAGGPPGLSARRSRCRRTEPTSRVPEALPLDDPVRRRRHRRRRQAGRAWSCTRRRDTPRGTLVNALLHHVDGLSGIGGDATAPGHRAPARSRHVGRDGDREERSRASRARRGSSTIARSSKEYIALVWGAPRPDDDRRADRPRSRATGRRCRAARAARRAGRSRASSRPEPLRGVSLRARRDRAPAVRIRFACIWRDRPPRRRRRAVRRRPTAACRRDWRRSRGSSGRSCTRPGSPSVIPATAAGYRSRRRCRPTWPTAWPPCAGQPSDDTPPTRRLSRRLGFNGRVFHVERDRVRLSNGRTVQLDVVRHRGSVVLIPQPTGESDSDPPVPLRHRPMDLGAAGRIATKPGEGPIAAARRECQEEIGLRPRRIPRLTRSIPRPASATRR